jgi:hypothetical protein
MPTWFNKWETKKYIYLYNILGVCLSGGGGVGWSSFPSIRPSKFLIPEEEDDGRGGRMAAVVYPNVPRSSDGFCAAAVMATNKELLQMFPLLWN